MDYVFSSDPDWFPALHFPDCFPIYSNMVCVLANMSSLDSLEITISGITVLMQHVTCVVLSQSDFFNTPCRRRVISPIHILMLNLR